jgi:hypothetical protein
MLPFRMFFMFIFLNGMMILFLIHEDNLFEKISLMGDFVFIVDA